MFESVPLNIPSVRMAVLHNTGQNHAFFKVSTHTHSYVFFFTTVCIHTDSQCHSLAEPKDSLWRRDRTHTTEQTLEKEQGDSGSNTETGADSKTEARKKTDVFKRQFSSISVTGVE